MLAVAVATAPALAAMPKSAMPAVVNVVATADQKFSPNHIVLHANKPQTLRFTSAGGVHGVASKELGIPQTTISPDKPVSITVTPKKVGTYTIPCTIVCGPGHADMSLTVDVKP